MYSSALQQTEWRDQKRQVRSYLYSGYFSLPTLSPAIAEPLGQEAGDALAAFVSRPASCHLTRRPGGFPLPRYCYNWISRSVLPRGSCAGRQ